MAILFRVTRACGSYPQCPGLFPAPPPKPHRIRVFGSSFAWCPKLLHKKDTEDEPKRPLPQIPKSYLILSKFGYHFRLSVPQDLRAIVGKTEFRSQRPYMVTGRGQERSQRDMAGGQYHLTQERIDRVHATVGTLVSDGRLFRASGQTRDCYRGWGCQFRTRNLCFSCISRGFFWAGLFICAGSTLGQVERFPGDDAQDCGSLFGLVPVASAVFWFIRSQRAKHFR